MSGWASHLFDLRWNFGHNPVLIELFLLLEVIQEGIQVFAARFEEFLARRSDFFNDWVSTHSNQSPGDSNISSGVTIKGVGRFNSPFTLSNL